MLVNIFFHLLVVDKISDFLISYNQPSRCPFPPVSGFSGRLVLSTNTDQEVSLVGLLGGFSKENCRGKHDRKDVKSSNRPDEF